MTDTPAADEAVEGGARSGSRPGDAADDRAGAGGGPESGAGSAKPPVDVRRYLPWVGLFIALWASLPKYSGPVLNTSNSAEFADHIVPSVLVGVVSLVALVAARRATGPTAVPFFCGMAILLAGFWMVATHVPLISEAFRDLAPWAATVYHSSAAFAVFGFGLFWTVVHWPDLAAVEAAQSDRKAAAAEG